MRPGDGVRIVGLGMAATLSVASYSTPGERAADCPDEIPWGEEEHCWSCPEDEVCSAKTPDGLYFATTAWTDRDGTPLAGLQAVTQGGIETIRVLTRIGLGSPPFDLPFEAVSSDTAIVTVVGVDGPDVTLAGGQPGSAYLRLLEPGTGRLYDRILVDVSPPRGMWLQPCPYATQHPDCSHADEGFGEGIAWGVLAGVPTEVRADLGDGVDQSMSLEAHGGVRGEQTRWDTLRIEAPEPGTVFVRAFTGERKLRAELPVLDRIDAIGWVPSRIWLGATQPPDEGRVSGIYCFRATRGEHAIVGTQWSFAAVGAIGILEVSGAPPNCVFLDTVGDGEGALTVTTGGVVRSYSVTVGVSERAVRLRDAIAEGAPGTPGERAQRRTAGVRDRILGRNPAS